MQNIRQDKTNYFMVKLTCQQLRKIFKDLQNTALKENQVNKVADSDIEYFKQQTMKQLERIQIENDYTDFQELAFYQEKFTDLQRIIGKNKKKRNQKQLQSSIKQILNCSLPSALEFSSSEELLRSKQNKQAEMLKQKEKQKNKEQLRFKEIQKQKEIQKLKQIEAFQEREKQRRKSNYSEQMKRESSQLPKFNIKATDSFDHAEQKQQPYQMFKDQKMLNSQEMNQEIKTSAIKTFFQEKQKKKSMVSFKNLFNKDEISVMSSRAFRKKKTPLKDSQKDRELQKLIQQNKRLHNTLTKKEQTTNELNEFEKNILKQEKEQCLERINELEQEIQQLSRNNYKLKEMQKSKRVETIYNESKREETYIPYVMNTQPNDLNKISKKGSHKIKVEQPKDEGINLMNKNQFDFNFLDKHFQAPQVHKLKPKEDNFILQDLLNESEDEPRRINKVQSQNKESELQSFKSMKKRQDHSSSDIMTQFESFSMAKTLYNNSSLFLNASKNQIAIDSVTSTRNKVSFFKNSLVIVKDNQIQIAFKKSQLDSTLSKLRLIFYINNKTRSSQDVDIQYDYELSSYYINVTEKLRFIGPGKQSRQVLQITLVSEKDLNSVIDCHISIGSQRYDLWVPVCFVEWASEKIPCRNNFEEMVIQPDRQFGSYESLVKLLPLSKKEHKNKNEFTAFLYGKSKFGNDCIRFNWWEKQLSIQGSQRIIDFIGFVMHHFK